MTERNFVFKNLREPHSSGVQGKTQPVKITVRMTDKQFAETQVRLKEISRRAEKAASTFKRMFQ